MKPLLIILCLCCCYACSEVQELKHGPAASAQPIAQGDDVITLNWDINATLGQMRLYNGDAPPFIDFNKPLQNNKAQLTGTWSSSWTSEDFPASEIHEYILEFVADGSCIYREKQGCGFINHFGQEEKIVADVYIAKGHWRLARNNKIYIGFQHIENIESQHSLQALEQAPALL